MSMCRVVSSVFGRRCLLWPVRSFVRTLLGICPTSFCTPRSNLPITAGISWLPTFASQSPILKSISFLMIVLEGLVCLHRAIQLQLLWHSWLGHKLGLLNSLFWKWTEISLSFLRLHPSNSYQTLVGYEGYSISSKGFLPTIVYIMVIWIKFSQFPSILVHWFQKCWCSLLPSPVWALTIYINSWA